MRTVRIAADDAERALLWKGRKSAFGAIARIKPNYYLHDTVVPRAQLPGVLAQVYEIAAATTCRAQRVPRRRRQPAPAARLDARAGRDGPGAGRGRGDRAVSVAAGGVLSGEHGIGLEKRDLMPLMFSAVDLAPQAALRAAFDPDGRANPGKVLPSPAGCGDLSCQGGGRGARGSDGVRRRGRRRRPVTITGLGHAGRTGAGVRRRRAPAGIDWIQPAEMTVSCGAGTLVAELDDALRPRAAVAIPPTGTVGGALAVGAAASAGSATDRCATPCCRPGTCRRPAASSRPVGRR